MSCGLRVLLATDRVFMPVRDGSTRLYRLWYDTLRELGAALTIVSFDHARARWSAPALTALAAEGTASHVFDLHAGRFAAARRGASAAYGLATGSRFAPPVLNGTIPYAVALDKLLLGDAFDVVLVNKVATADLLGIGRLRQSTAARLLDLHDSYPRRIALLRQVYRRLLGARPQLLAHRTACGELLQCLRWASEHRMMKAELARLAAFDLVLFNTEEEAALYHRAGLAEDGAALLPIGAAAVDSPANSQPRFTFGMIGSAAAFNVEALLFLARDVWPIIRRAMPAASLLVCGEIARIGRRLLAAGLPGATFVDWTEDVADFYRDVGVVLVPLLHGTGCSVKTIEAAAYGAPVVSTPIGLRGHALRAGEEVMVAATGAEFGAAAVALAASPLRAWRIGARARAAVCRRHSQQAVRARAGALIAQAIARRRARC